MLNRQVPGFAKPVLQDRRINARSLKRPWLFLVASISTLVMLGLFLSSLEGVETITAANAVPLGLLIGLAALGVWFRWRWAFWPAIIGLVSAGGLSAFVVIAGLVLLVTDPVSVRDEAFLMVVTGLLATIDTIGAIDLWRSRDQGWFEA